MPPKTTWGDKLAENRFIFLYLIMLVLTQAMIGLLEWRHGFVEYDADGFARSLLSWDWAQHGGLQVGAWLPLQFWINGSLMHFWPDLLHVPRLVNFTASAITTINFFFIGNWLFGRANAYLTAMLAALFPWQIWFGLSGMSESLTNMFLSFGVLFFCRWLATERNNNLYWAGLGLLGATALRYEAWFYSVIYALLVLGVVYFRQSHKIHWKLLVPLAIPFLFILFWVGLSWVQMNSPLAFASITSQINSQLDEANHSVTLLQRIIFYPQVLLELAWRLTIPAIVGSVLLFWKPVRFSRIYLTLVWGEFAIFILTTLPYNNIAPGSSRYPVSNLLLLLPVIVYVFQFIAGKLRQNSLRGVVQLALLLLILSQLQITFTRPTDFPNGDWRQAATWLKQAWANNLLPADLQIPLDLPPSSNDDFNAHYALRVLTNHPDNFLLTTDFNQLKAEATDPEKPVYAWIQLDSALGPDGKTTVTAADNKPMLEDYQHILRFGSLTIAYDPYHKSSIVTPTSGTANQTFTFTADGFIPGEQVDVWVSRNDNSTKSLQRQVADANGKVTLQYQPDRDTPGHWAITAHGSTSSRYVIGRFDLN